MAAWGRVGGGSLDPSDSGLPCRTDSSPFLSLGPWWFMFSCIHILVLFHIKEGGKDGQASLEDSGLLTPVWEMEA